MKALLLLAVFIASTAFAEKQAKTAAIDTAGGVLPEVFGDLHKQYCAPFEKDVKRHGDCLEFERAWETQDLKGSEECARQWEGDPNGRDEDCVEESVKKNMAARHARFKICGGIESYLKDKKAFQDCFEKKTKK